MFFTSSVLLRRFSFALAPLLLSSIAHAAAWDKANDPKLFNTDWHPTNYEYRFQNLPLEGSLPPSKAPWADSYWMKQRGAMTYRWQQFNDPNMNQDLTESERQRLFFNYKLYSKRELQGMTEDQIETFLGTDILRKAAKATVKGGMPVSRVDRSQNENKAPRAGQEKTKSTREYFNKIRKG